MPKIALTRVKVGMVVASPITNLDDVVLVGAGCTLSERHLRLLRQWGVADVNVEGVGGEDAALLRQVALDPRHVEAAKARFWQFEETNPVQQEIVRLVLRREALNQCGAATV